MLSHVFVEKICSVFSSLLNCTKQLHDPFVKFLSFFSTTFLFCKIKFYWFLIRLWTQLFWPHCFYKADLRCYLWTPVCYSYLPWQPNTGCMRSYFMFAVVPIILMMDHKHITNIVLMSSDQVTIDLYRKCAETQGSQIKCSDKTSWLKYKWF